MAHRKMTIRLKAAVPPLACRVFYVGAYGIYYSVDEVERIVTVPTVVDQRRDPNVRFAALKLD